MKTLQSFPRSVRDAVLMELVLGRLCEKADYLKRNDPCPWHTQMARHLAEASRMQRDRVTAMKASGLADALSALNVGGGLTLPELLAELEGARPQVHALIESTESRKGP